MNSFESLLSRSNQHGNLGRNDREFLRQKANAGSEDGNGGDEVKGTVVIGQALLCAQSAAIARDGNQLAELWRWVSAKVLRQQLNQATVETARCATKKKQ